MSTPFVRKASEYVRDLDIIGNYQKNAARYLSISTGQPYEAALAWVKENIQPEDPRMKILHRENGGDRVKKFKSFTKYVEEINHTGRLIGPNLVCYSNPDKKLSFISDFIEKGLAKRAKIKKRGQKAYMEGDMEMAVFCDNQQGRVKIINNSISGAHGSPHNPLYNRSAHTTLTSVCRVMVSYSNALAEKLISGFRQYSTPEIALADLTALIENSDHDAVEKAMKKYELNYPSAEYVYDHVMRSCLPYWRSKRYTKELATFINCMTPTERAIVAYVDDLYAVRENNDCFMRTFIGDLIRIPETGIEDPDTWISKADSDTIALASLILADTMKGRQVSKLKEEDSAGYALFGAVIKNIYDTLMCYKDFIIAFLRTDNLPPSVYDIPFALRRSVIISDTDSTILTVENWIRWYFGANLFNAEAVAVSCAMTYLDSQILVHKLALVSRYMGIPDRNLFRLMMKNEFYQPVVGVPNMTKHYFSYIQACEGNVYPEKVLDTKGVNLKNSRLPQEIRDKLNNYMRWVMDRVMDPGSVTTFELLETPVRLAHEINRSLRSLETTYLYYTQIKTKQSYSGENPTAIAQDKFWNHVFAYKYNPSDPPPYQGVKVPVVLSSRAAILEWAQTLDGEMRERLKEYMSGLCTYRVAPGVVRVNKDDTVILVEREDELGTIGKIFRYNGQTRDVDLKAVGFEHPGKLDSNEWVYVGPTKKDLNNIVVPVNNLVDGKLPSELAAILDYAKIETEMLAGFYAVMETCGLYLRNGKNTRLLSQEISPETFKRIDEQKGALSK